MKRANIGGTFADSGSDYPFETKEYLFKKSVIICMVKQATRTKLLKMRLH